MSRPNRRYAEPHYNLSDIHAVAAEREIVITRKAAGEATTTLPSDIVDIDFEIQAIVGSLVKDEFAFSERRIRVVNAKRVETWVDVYKVDFEGSDIWVKLKLEEDFQGKLVVIISFHPWDDARPI